MHSVVGVSPVSLSSSSRETMPMSFSPLSVSLMPAPDDDIFTVILTSWFFSYCAASFSMSGVTDDEPDTVIRSLSLPHPPSETSEPHIAVAHSALTKILTVFFMIDLLYLTYLDCLPAQNFLTQKARSDTARAF